MLLHAGLSLMSLGNHSLVVGLHLVVWVHIYPDVGHPLHPAPDRAVTVERILIKLTYPT